MIGKLLGHTQVQTTARYGSPRQRSRQIGREPHHRQDRGGGRIVDRTAFSAEPATPFLPDGNTAVKQYAFLCPSMEKEVRITTDPDYYEEHAENVELWAPGNPLFRAREILGNSDVFSSAATLKEVLAFPRN